jgi:hypothetical protein
VLAVTDDGTWLFDVRPANRIGDDDRAKFAASAELALACGWRYLLVTGWRRHTMATLDAFSSQRRHLVIRPQGDCQFDYRHVPQHLPGAWIDARFSDVPARHFRYLNTVAAIRLVQMSSGGSHATAGEQLGIPSGTVSHAVHHVRVWTRDPASSERFTAAVREFADHLNHSASLVDYARRRAQLAEWIIPPDDWKQVSAQIASAPGLKQAGRAASQRRRALFSVLAWAAATSGEPVLAPLVRAAPGRASQLRKDIAQARYHARARPAQFPAALARAAESYGASLAAAIDSATAAPSGRP